MAKERIMDKHYEVGISSEEDGTETVVAYRAYPSALRYAQRLLALSDWQLENIAENIQGRITEVFIDRWTVDSNGVTEPDEEFTAVVFHREVNHG